MAPIFTSHKDLTFNKTIEMNKKWLYIPFEFVINCMKELKVKGKYELLIKKCKDY